MSLIVLLIVLLPIIAMWVLFTKANQPGWAAIIPIYNFFVMLKIAGKPWWWVILFLIPVVNIVFYVLMIHAVAKNFGQSIGFTIGMIFLPFIFWLILAFGTATYKQVE